MNVLCYIFNDENTVCESLENFLGHFYTASTLPHQTVREIGDLILHYNKTECLPPKELHKCLISWDEFQEFVLSHFSKQEQFLSCNDSNLKFRPISLSIVDLLQNRAWEHLYGFVGTEMMKIILTKCYISVGVGNNSYMCLYMKDIRQLQRKCKENISHINKPTISNKSCHSTGLTVTRNKKVATRGKRSVELNLKKCMYRTNIFPCWPLNHVLSRSNLEWEVVSRVIDDILHEDVGIQMSFKDIQTVKEKLSSFRNFIIYLVQKHKSMAPYNVVLQNVLHGRNSYNTDMKVSVC